MIGGFHKIPDAIKAVLEAGTYQIGTVAFERKTQIYVATEASTLRVVVAPIDKVRTLGTRRSTGWDWRIGIFVIEKVAANTPEEKQTREDELMTLADELEAVIDQANSVNVDSNDFPLTLGDEPKLPVQHDAYRENNTFISVIEVILKEQ